MAPGAQYAGIASAAIAPAYALVGEGFAKLTSVRDQITPGAVFEQDTTRFAPATDAVDAANAGTRPIRSRKSCSPALAPPKPRARRCLTPQPGPGRAISVFRTRVWC